MSLYRHDFFSVKNLNHKKIVHVIGACIIH